MTDKPHNNFFTFVFSKKELVQDFLTQLATDVADEIDIESIELDTTKYVDKSLNEFYSDIVYNAKTKENQAVKVALLFEHKSYPERFPRLQLMDYLLGIWRQNLDDKQTLMPVIPIIFYHGERKWHYKKFEEHFGELSEKLKTFLPRFDYHLVDLANYSDEFILSLKQSFLINSLIAFKHKNDDDYVRQHYTKIFINLEKITDEESMNELVHSLAIYIISSTKIKIREMIELTEKLPPAVHQKGKTTLEQLIEFGLEQGLEQGIEQGRRELQNKSIQMAIDALDDEFTVKSVAKITKIPISIILLLEKIYRTKKVQKNDKQNLVKQLMQQFKYLSDKDIGKFAKLKEDKVVIIRQKLAEEKKVEE